MKSHQTLRLVALTIAAAAPLSGFAAGNTTNTVAATSRFAASETFMNGQSIYGQPATNAAASRVIDLSRTRHAMVNYGETVSFRGEGGTPFAWTFDGLGNRSVKISKIAPAGFAAKPALVRVGGNPLFRN